MPVDDTTLAGLPFFARLSSAQRRALGQVLVERRFAPGQVIFEEGAPAMTCGFVTSGAVHAEIETGAGYPRQRMNSLGVGEIFGEVSLIDGGRRSATCVAADGGAVVAMLSRDDFTQLFEAGNPFAFSMVRAIARQLARRMQNVVHVWRETARAADAAPDD